MNAFDNAIVAMHLVEPCIKTIVDLGEDVRTEKRTMYCFFSIVLSVTQGF